MIHVCRHQGSWGSHTDGQRRRQRLLQRHHTPAVHLNPPLTREMKHFLTKNRDCTVIILELHVIQFGKNKILDVSVVLPLPSRSLELQRLQRHKPSSWQWSPVPVPIVIYRPSVTALSHWPPEVCPLWSCCRRCPPSRLWCTCCGPRFCSCLVGGAALRCLSGRCRWAATGDQRCVKTNIFFIRIEFCEEEFFSLMCLIPSGAWYRFETHRSQDVEWLWRLWTAALSARCQTGYQLQEQPCTVWNHNELKID